MDGDTAIENEKHRVSTIDDKGVSYAKFCRVLQCFDRQYQTQTFICLFKNGSVILKMNCYTSH